MTATSKSADESGTPQTTSYYAEVESHFVELRGSPLFITPKEWQLVAEWERAGVPLEVVKEAIGRVFERPKTRSRRRTLAYCRQSVEAAFRRFKEARFGGASAEGRSDTDEGEGEGEGEGERVVSRLSELVARLDRAAGGLGGGAAGSRPRSVSEAMRAAARELEALGRSQAASIVRVEDRLEDLDRQLTEALERGLDEASRTALTSEAERSLASYRERMPEDVYRTAVRSAFLRRLRAHFGVSRLSLF